jgi:MFS family permease
MTFERNAAAPWPTAARGWYAVAALWVAYVVSYVDRLAITFLIDPIKRDLAITDTQISLLVGFSFALFYSFVGLPIARYADRGHRVGLIVCGVLVWSAMTAVCGLATSFAALLLARIGVAVGEAVLQPAAMSLISDYFPRDRKTVPISAYLTASFAGVAIAYAAGGGLLTFAQQWDRAAWPILANLAPWQLVFLFLAVPSFLAALLIALIREPARQETTQHAPGGTSGLSIRALLALAHQHRGAYLTIVGGPLLFCIYVFALTVWLPSMLSRVHGMPASEAGALIGTSFLFAGPLGALGASALYRWLERRGHRDAVMRAALYCNVAALIPGVLVCNATSGEMAAAAFFSFTVLGAGITTLPQAALQMAAPNEARSQFAAIWGLGVNLFGLGCGPTIAAVLSDALSADGTQLATALGIMAVPCLVGCAVVIYLGLPAVRRCFGHEPSASA